MGTFGVNLRALRHMRHVTQQEMADTVGVSRVTVAKWESGSIDHPRLELLEKLCKEYKLKPDDLLSASHGLAAREPLGGEDPEDTSSFVLMDISGSEPTITARRTEVPRFVARAHSLAYAVETKLSRLAGTPATCHVVVDPHEEEADGSVVLLRLANGRLHFAQMKCGRNKVLLTVLDDEDAEDLFLERSEFEVLGRVVWWQAAEPMG